MTDFQSKVPTDKQKSTMDIYRNSFLQLAEEIMEDVPDCRERSLALTKLEEASMWLNKAIVNNENP